MHYPLQNYISCMSCAHRKEAWCQQFLVTRIHVVFTFWQIQFCIELYSRPQNLRLLSTNVLFRQRIIATWLCLAECDYNVCFLITQRFVMKNVYLCLLQYQYVGNAVYVLCIAYQLLTVNIGCASLLFGYCKTRKFHLQLIFTTAANA